MVKIIPAELREFYENAPEARHLSEDEQKLYDEACKPLNEKARDSLRTSLNGSTFWKVVFLTQLGVPVASLEQITSIANDTSKEARKFLAGFYEEAPSAVLRSAGDSYAKNIHIAKQLTKLTGKRTIKVPLIISGLRTKEDSNSEYGLDLERADNFSFFEAPELVHQHNERRFLKYDSRGIPILLSNEQIEQLSEEQKKELKTLYTRPDGVSRLYLNRNLNVNFRSDDLADSDGNGRVVVVSGEATAKNLDTYVSQRKAIQTKYLVDLNALRESITADINSR